MSNLDIRKITNSFQDVRLVSLANWQKAHEIEPRDRNGPYIVVQEGYDPEDVRMIVEEYVLGRSGKWLSLGHFFSLPVPDRRAEFVFGMASEVMKVMGDLPSKVEVMCGKPDSEKAAPPEGDEMAAALQKKPAS